ISGPLRDSVFALPMEELSLGRDASNGLHINDPAVSRRHCLIHREGGGFKLRDLESRNGTLVNGEAVTDHWLHHLDEIAVGDSVFRFLTDEDEHATGTTRAVEFEDDKETHSVAEIQPSDVLYLQPDKILSELPATSRLARNLNALLKISRVVHSIRDLEALQAEILTLIFEVAPAERGAILLDGSDPKNFASIYARNRMGADGGSVRVS